MSATNAEPPFASGLPCGRHRALRADAPRAAVDTIGAAPNDTQITRGNDAMLLNTPTGFAQHHPWDRSFFPLSVAVIWVVILLGFVPAIMRHVASGEPDYPLVIHIHAVAFVGFLVLLSVQVALIRGRRYDVHRRLVLLAVRSPWPWSCSDRGRRLFPSRCISARS